MVGGDAVDILKQPVVPTTYTVVQKAILVMSMEGVAYRQQPTKRCPGPRKCQPLSDQKRLHPLKMLSAPMVPHALAQLTAARTSLDRTVAASAQSARAVLAAWDAVRVVTGDALLTPHPPGPLRMQPMWNGLSSSKTTTEDKTNTTVTEDKTNIKVECLVSAN